MHWKFELAHPRQQGVIVHNKPQPLSTQSIQLCDEFRNNTTPPFYCILSGTHVCLSLQDIQQLLNRVSPIAIWIGGFPSFTLAAGEAVLRRFQFCRSRRMIRGRAPLPRQILIGRPMSRSGLVCTAHLSFSDKTRAVADFAYFWK